MKKRLIASILSLAVTFSVMANFNHSFYAAGDARITVNDTQNGGVYSAYKIFDATQNGDAVSYTLPTGSTFLDQVTASNLFDTFANGNLTYIVPKTGTTNEAIITWAQGLNLTEVADTKTENGADTQEVLEVPYGYYLVKSTVNQGAVVMVTSATPNATIQEKNSKPTWGQDGGKTTDKGSYAIGETVNYTIDYKNAVNYADGKKVYQYEVTDTMPAETVVKMNNDIKVELVTGGQTIVLQESTNSDKGTYNIERTAGTQNFKITIPWALTHDAKTNGDAEDFYYNGITEIRVTYSGVVMDGAAEGSFNNDTNKNTATVTYNVGNKADDPKEVKVYDGSIEIQKVDADGGAALNGAEFIIQDDTTKLYLTQNAANVVKWVDEVNAKKYIIENGKVLISGLAEGTYNIIETKAPAGYNLKKDPTQVKLTKAAVEGSDDTLVNISKIENSKGRELPSTGGVGTVVMIGLGGITALYASIKLTAKKRLEIEEDIE